MINRMLPKEVAKLARKELKKAFPGIKFSVRTSLYAGGSSIDARWIDGPTEEQVKKVIGYLHGADFDGMIDLKTYRDNEYGNDFIFCNREFSADFLQGIAQIISERYGKPAPEVKTHDDYKNAWFADSWHFVGGGEGNYHWNMTTVANREAIAMSEEEVKNAIANLEQQDAAKENLANLVDMGITQALGAA